MPSLRSKRWKDWGFVDQGERNIIGCEWGIEDREGVVHNGSKQLLAKKGNMRLIKCRLTTLQYINEVHEVENPTIIPIGLGRGISAAVCPCGEVLEAKESCAEGVRVIRACEECVRFPEKPLAERRDDPATSLKGVPLERVHVQDDAMVQEDKGAIPVGTCGVGGYTKDRAVKGVTILQPVHKPLANRRIAENIRCSTTLT